MTLGIPRHDPTRYVMLIASLPHHGRLFAAKQTPLSRTRLERRLRMMHAEDRALLDAVESVVAWHGLPGDATDADVVQRGQEVLDSLAAAGLDTLWTALRNRLELRTLVAALRRRHRGAPPPGPDEVWGIGRFLRRIRENWETRDFGLGVPFPWVGQAQDHLDNDEPLALQKLLIGRAWQDLGRLSLGHDFDVTAVIIYVLRWEIIDRWTRLDGAAAQQRFDALLAQGMGDWGAVFERDAA